MIWNKQLFFHNFIEHKDYNLSFYLQINKMIIYSDIIFLFILLKYIIKV